MSVARMVKRLSFTKKFHPLYFDHHTQIHIMSKIMGNRGITFQLICENGTYFNVSSLFQVGDLEVQSLYSKREIVIEDEYKREMNVKFWNTQSSVDMPAINIPVILNACEVGKYYNLPNNLNATSLTEIKVTIFMKKLKLQYKPRKVHFIHNALQYECYHVLLN